MKHSHTSSPYLCFGTGRKHQYVRAGRILRRRQWRLHRPLAEPLVRRELIRHDAQIRVRLERHQAGAQYARHRDRMHQRTLLADVLQMLGRALQVRFAQQPAPALQLAVPDAPDAPDHQPPRLHRLRDQPEDEVHQLLQPVPPGRGTLSPTPVRNVDIDRDRFEKLAPIVGRHREQPALVLAQTVATVHDGALLLHARLAERFRVFALLAGSGQHVRRCVQSVRDAVFVVLALDELFRVGGRPEPGQAFDRVHVGEVLAALGENAQRQAAHVVAEAQSVAVAPELEDAFQRDDLQVDG